MNSYLVDDGGLELLLVWAENATKAKTICRLEHGPDQKYDAYGQRLPKEKYVAEVTKITLEGVTPPKTPTLETRPEVLDLASRHPVALQRDA